RPHEVLVEAVGALREPRDVRRLDVGGGVGRQGAPVEAVDQDEDGVHPAQAATAAATPTGESVVTWPAPASSATLRCVSKSSSPGLSVHTSTSAPCSRAR